MPGYEPPESRLACSGRTPEYQGRNHTAIEHDAKRPAWRQKLRLTHHFIQRSRTHSVCERPLHDRREQGGVTIEIVASFAPAHWIITPRSTTSASLTLMPPPVPAAPPLLQAHPATLATDPGRQHAGARPLLATRCVPSVPCQAARNASGRYGRRCKARAQA